MASSVVDESPQPRRLAAEERRSHLLDVAAALVVEQGVEAVTMERLAQRAGVSRGLGYAYFENSDDLIAALYRREAADFDAQVAEATAGASCVEDHLRGAVTVYFDILAQNGVLLSRLFDVTSPTPALAGESATRDRGVERLYGELLTREMDLPPKRARAVASILMRALPYAAELWGRGVLRRKEAIDLFVVMALGAATAVAGHSFDPSAERARPPAKTR